MINNLEPCKFNYFQKRIERDSEIVPIFKNSCLLKLENVKLLVSHAHEPIVYVNDGDSRLILNNETIKLTKASRKDTQKKTFWYFCNTLFFDLLISQKNGMSMCIARNEADKVNLTILLSNKNEDDTEVLLRNPSLIFERYNFSEIKDSIDTIDDYENQNNKENIFENNDNQKDTLIKDLICEDQNEGENKQNIQQNQCCDTYDNIMNIQAHEDKSNSKFKFFHKIKEKVFGNHKRKKNTSNKTSFLILGEKIGENNICLKKNKLKDAFCLDNNKDLELVKSLIKQDNFYIEISSIVNICILKEKEITVLIQSSVTVDDSIIFDYVEKLSTFLKKLKEKK